MATAAENISVDNSAPVQVDSGVNNDGDSTLGDSASVVTDTTSINSWIREYRLENGRRYHTYGDQEYWGPNDDKAQEHMDLAHELFTRTFNGALYLAPLESPMRVLDVGTGTGIWAVDFADRHPQAEVLGTDLSPIQPLWIPPNCKFEVDDAEREWTFPKDHFDYIHVRTLYGGIAHWPRFYARCLQHLKPGGYLEHAEYAAKMHSEDGTMAYDSALAVCGRYGELCYSKLNRPEGDLNIYETMERRITDAGFKDVQCHKFKWPLGTWPKDKKMKELGLWAKTHLDIGLEGYMMRLMTVMLGKTPEEVYLLASQVRKQMEDRKTHAIWPMNVCVARKPEPEAKKTVP